MSSEKSFEIEPNELQKIVSNYKSRTQLEDLNYFNQNNISDILSKLKTDPEKGISSTENRKKFFGTNKLFIKPLPNYCYFVWKAMNNLMIIILITSAIVSIVLGAIISENKKKDWVDGLSIVIAIFIVVLVSSITQYTKEKKFRELNKSQNERTKYKVIRRGVPENLISEDVLVGDLILINYGDIMCADILLIDGDLKMDESSLTGESELMKKESYEKCLEERDKFDKNNNNINSKIPSPIILSGTHCQEGAGKGIVIAVGEFSQKGIIRRTIENAKENSKTPLEIKIDKIAKRIGYFGIGIGLITFAVCFIRYIIKFSNDLKNYNKLNEEERKDFSDPKDSLVKELLDIIMLSVSVIVVVVPEGLPLTVTLSLAFSVNKLMANNILVRKMDVCETMGGANYICVDKTGTLTKNEMSVFRVLTGKIIYELDQYREMENVGKVDIEENKDDYIRQIREDPGNKFKNENFWNLLKISIALNVECAIKKLDVPNVNGDTETYETKNKSDKPFIDFLYRFKTPLSKERDIYLDDINSFKQIPFDSKRQRSTTFIYNSYFPTKYRLFTKGGGEFALKYCKYYIDPDTGEKEEINESVALYIKNKMNDFNKNRLRSLYIAYKDITEEEYNNANKENIQNKFIDQYDLVFLCIFGIRDSLRDGVKEAVEKLYDASVKIIMVTGDNIITSTTIAKDCGILGNEVDIKNLEINEIEQNPEKMNDENSIKREEYIQKLLEDRPYSLTGNSFYHIIGGLICKTCQKESTLCTCPKTENEAKKKAEKNNSTKQKIKKDKIKDMNRFLKIITRLKVLAQSQPLHKYALVLGLKELNNVVTVVGDGTNDAPALSKSDVGFAMFAGTDIAKESSDIIILDNNFSSIITIIIYGRNIYDNIRKFLQFQLSVNFCACILVFIYACIGNETLLFPIQILWINLIMDSLGSLALATEPPYEELLKREPTKKKEFIINGKMFKHILFQTIVLVLLLILLYFFAPDFIKEDNLKRIAENYIIKNCYNGYPGKGPEYIISGIETKWGSNIKLIGNEALCGAYSKEESLDLAHEKYIEYNSSTTHMTMIFNIFVFYTLFNQINCRIIDDSFNIFKRLEKNIFFIIIIVLEIGLQIILIFFGSSTFHIIDGGLTGVQWGICIGFSAITFVISIFAKSIPIDKFFDKPFSSSDKKKDINPIAPVIPDIKNAVNLEIKPLPLAKDEDDDDEDIISEKVDLNMNKYDFNNGGQGLIYENKINKIYSEINTKDHETGIEKENNNANIINENENLNQNEISNKIEEFTKKYKITNLGGNLMNLPENYSTDDEDEYKFINLMNESNDSYELAVDSKIIKVYAKVVS